MLGNVFGQALLSLESRRVPPRRAGSDAPRGTITGKRPFNPHRFVRLSSMNSIGSAHAHQPAPPRVFLHVSTPDRILFIIGSHPPFTSTSRCRRWRGPYIPSAPCANCLLELLK